MITGVVAPLRRPSARPPGPISTPEAGHLTRAILLALLLVATSMAAGCGDDDAITRQAFETSLTRREHFAPATASCVSSYLFDELSSEHLQRVAEGSGDVPAEVWGRYVRVVTACQYHDELGVAGPLAEGAAS
jgi:hypothetical protein